METKWWEYYAVRYFVGTVAGAGVVAFLNCDPLSPFKGALGIFGEFKDATFTGVSLFAAIGFAFCYVASAPILLLHATRQHLRLTTLMSKPFLQAASIFVCTMVIAWVAHRYFSVGVALALGLVFGLQLSLVMAAALTRFRSIEIFYRKLANARSPDSQSSSQSSSTPRSRPESKDDFVTSYRHLREHGNAFLIMLLEAVLALALYKLPDARHAFPLLVAWVVPASFVWFLGSALESRLVSNDQFP